MMGTELSLFERMGGTYTEVDGIYYPNIVMDDDIAEGAAVFTGRYGDAWKTYMMENHAAHYSHLLFTGKLNDKAREVNGEAQEMLDTIMERYLEKHRPEHSDSTMEMWRLREQAKAVAEETVFADIVYHIR